MAASAVSEWPQAVVVGSGLNALGVVRSLGREGVRVTVVDDANDGPAARSRFAAFSRQAVSGTDGLIAHLCALEHKVPPMLFLTQEATVAAVSAHRQRLAGRYRFLFPPAETLASLMDKRAFQNLAAEHGFPVPRAVVVTSRKGGEKASSLIYPCILKPVAKSEAWERERKKAYRFESHAELCRFLASLDEEPPALIVQEWIEGTDSDVYFTLVYRDELGQTRASFTGRKLRQWPPNVGGTASCTAAPQFEAELHALTTRFFDAVGFVGMGSMEYKRDSRSGRFIMVEPTVGRSDYQEEVATLNGINIPMAAFCSLAGLTGRFDRRSLRPAVWRDKVGEARSRQANPDVNLPQLPPSVRTFDALFRVNDPGPWLADLSERVFARLSLRKAP